MSEHRHINNQRNNYTFANLLIDCGQFQQTLSCFSLLHWSVSPKVDAPQYLLYLPSMHVKKSHVISNALLNVCHSTNIVSFLNMASLLLIWQSSIVSQPFTAPSLSSQIEQGCSPDPLSPPHRFKFIVTCVSTVKHRYNETILCNFYLLQWNSITISLLWQSFQHS